MRKLTVDFGHATFAHEQPFQQLSCSAHADLQGETQTIEDRTISARAFCQDEFWIRCRVPLSFYLVFAFDKPVVQACHYIEIQQALADYVTSRSLWLPLGLKLSNCYIEEGTIDANVWSFSIILSFELSANAITGKINKRWRRVSSSTVNDVNVPSELRSARLHAVTITCSFAQSRLEHAQEATAHDPETLKDSCEVLTKTCINSILGIESRPPTDVRSETIFEHTLQDAFPSVFCPAYTEGISQRSLLVSSVARTLAAFQKRTTTGAATADPKTRGGNDPLPQRSPRDTTNTPCSSAQELELQFWRFMLDQTRIPTSPPRQHTTLHNKSSAYTINIASSGTFYAPDAMNCSVSGRGGLIGSEDIDMEQCLSERNPDQAQELSLELLGYGQTGREMHHSAHGAACPSEMSFEELAEIHMLMVCNEDEWTSYRESHPTSSQDTAVPSDLDDDEEALQAYEDYDNSMQSCGWAEIIGQREQLTQISGRGDPLLDPVLRRAPGQIGEDDFLEALHISTFSLEHTSSISTQAVTDLDEIILDTTATVSATTLHNPIGSTLHELPQPDTIEGSDTCSDLFGPVPPNMHIDHTEMEDWRTRLASPDIFDDDVNRRAIGRPERDSYGPAPEPNRRLSMSRGFLKRASTIPISSSSESGSPRRHRSIFQRLSRSSSTKSKHEDSDVSDPEFHLSRGREVEIKRRKTLDDYEQNKDGEDDEMLFA